jgi:ATP-dependent Clp protease ATP-binding subunit ClpC
VSPQYAAWLLLLFCSVLALILSPSAAFSPSSSRFSFPTRLLRPSSSISISSLFVFERMSEDCIAGLVEAQAVASKYQSASVGTDCLLAGCLQHPTPSLRKTLTRYKLTYRNCQKVLKELYKESDQDNNNNNNFLSSFQFRKQKEEDRPFSTAAKQVLQRAGTYVAVTNSNNNKNNKNKDTTSTTTIETHHVFLSLLEYTPTKDIDDDEDDTTAPTTTRNNPESDAWAVLQRMQGWKEGRNNDHDNNEFASAREISLALVKQIQANPQSDKRELVTGGGSSSSSSSTTSTPTLAECGVDLTEQARDGLLDPVYGREMEIRACLRTLLRRRKNNVCLIGDPGVGSKYYKVNAYHRICSGLVFSCPHSSTHSLTHSSTHPRTHSSTETAIAEGVAQLLVDEDTSKCPSKLQGYRLISLELSQLVSGTKYRGEFEERLQAILKELEDPKAPPTILFIDEIHNLVGAGAAEGGIDMANILKPYLARGQLQLIGATTIAEYRKYIEKDAALERRLQPVMVKETNVEQTISILEAVQSNYAKHHDVKYTPAALHAAAVLSERYITDRFLPDKALDLLDEAGAIAQLENDGVETPVVTEHVIAELISEMSGIPVGKLESSEMDRLRSLDDQLENRIKGQPKACSAVGRAIRRARSGLRDPKRPVASFLFCGPTGTGKTELCKTLAETYYGSEKDMIRIDMSEYMDKHTVSRLTGPPPGYIGYEEGGQLTEAVRRAPHSVVLLVRCIEAVTLAVLVCQWSLILLPLSIFRMRLKRHTKTF